MADDDGKVFSLGEAARWLGRSVDVVRGWRTTLAADGLPVLPTQAYYTRAELMTAVKRVPPRRARGRPLTKGGAHVEDPPAAGHEGPSAAAAGKPPAVPAANHKPGGLPGIDDLNLPGPVRPATSRTPPASDRATDTAPAGFFSWR